MQRKRQSFFLFALLRRSLPYQKVVQAEDNAKEKTKFFPICIAETKPTLSKGSASRGKYKINHIYFYCRGDAYPNNHGMAPVGSALLAMPSPPKVKWPCIPPKTAAKNEKTDLYVPNDGSQFAKDGSGKHKGRSPRMGQQFALSRNGSPLPALFTLLLLYLFTFQPESAHRLVYTG